ncbi:MAG: aminotransferase class I/II-fold pyridoxal phosphate-dependent enzyme [Limnochordia bacterium]
MLRGGSIPYLEGILEYIDSASTAFHTPGHKQGKGAYAPLSLLLGERCFQADVGDEVGGMEDADVLLDRAEELAARLYGVDRTYFLINGTTSALQAMLMGAFSPGDELLISRNMHLAAAAGLILAGLEPVFIPEKWCPHLGLPLGWDMHHWQKAGEEHPKAKGAFLVYPTYQGFCPDLAPLIDAVKAQGKLVLVDEAHGPHLALSSSLPPSACELGAHLVAHSAHKILGALTQSSFLHVQGKTPERLSRAVELLLSTSPSPLLLASLDGARAQMEEGEKLWDKALNLARKAQERIQELPGLSICGPDYVKAGLIPRCDPTKLVVCVQELGYTGWEAASLLKKCGIQVEMADWWTVLFLLTYADGPAEVDALVAGLEKLAATPPPDGGKAAARLLGEEIRPPAIPPRSLSPREAFFRPRVKVPLDQALGRTAAEIIAPYPPGSPIIIPGEVFTEEILDYLRLLKGCQVKVRGVDDPSLAEVAVVA